LINQGLLPKGQKDIGSGAQPLDDGGDILINGNPKDSQCFFVVFAVQL